MILQVVDCGIQPYNAIRSIQNEYVLNCQKEPSQEKLILCEHTPVITLGQRGSRSDIFLSPEKLEERGVEIASTDRGGLVTYHGPGQLVIYPVMSLKIRNIGVRDFVAKGLGVITSVLCSYGIKAEALLDPAGVWVKRDGVVSAKIASVGLRFSHGVSNHGFSVNVNCDLTPFSWFTPCGLPKVQVASVAGELDTAIPLGEFKSLFARSWAKEFEYKSLLF